MKHFSELTKEEVNKLWSRCVDAAISYTREINMSGLSEGGSHNIYTALENAIYDEWESAIYEKTKRMRKRLMESWD